MEYKHIILTDDLNANSLDWNNKKNLPHVELYFMNTCTKLDGFVLMMGYLLEEQVTVLLTYLLSVQKSIQMWLCVKQCPVKILDQITLELFWKYTKGQNRLMLPQKSIFLVKLTGKYRETGLKRSIKCGMNQECSTVQLTI